jgi:hypothetical protein
MCRCVCWGWGAQRAEGVAAGVRLSRLVVWATAGSLSWGRLADTRLGMLGDCKGGDAIDTRAWLPVA